MVPQRVMSPAANSTMSTNSSSLNSNYTADYRIALVTINTVVLVSGTISLSLMTHILTTSTTSITSFAVLNLIFNHFIFLVTVPFRIYYYVTENWSFGLEWCKYVSSMIHIHMYMSFIFYVIILITRLMTFYNKAEHMASFQRIHAFLVSAVVWIVILVLVPCVIHFHYGGEINNNSTNKTVCFKFGGEIGPAVKVLNYIISTLIMMVAAVLTALQANVLRILYRKHHQGCTSQQDFGAQLKSFCFALIMVVCFIPYHIFRFYYLEDLNLQSLNDVYLSLTTFNCLDMLTFLGRRTCYMCFLRKVVCV